MNRLPITKADEVAQAHVISFDRMKRSNPFFDMGYRYEWQCSCGQMSGGAATRKECADRADAHIRAMQR